MFVSEPMTPEQLEALALTTYIDELSRRLEHHEYEEDAADPVPRPPSPPPEYDRYGKRTNTREHRMTRELEVERTLAVYRALELIPGYIPPPSLTKLTRSSEKFYLPVRMHPEINFVGLLLGPRGNNLRHMESESGAKISIRGRGSVKEGSASAAQLGNEEELHCVVTAISLDSIQRAFKLIQTVVDTAVQTPEHQNDFKRLQLRELAELNGTLRNHENQLCSYCHQPGHRKFACPARREDIQRQSADLSRETSPADENSAAVEEFLNDIEDSAVSDPGVVNTASVAGIACNAVTNENHASNTIYASKRNENTNAMKHEDNDPQINGPSSTDSRLEKSETNGQGATTSEPHLSPETEPLAPPGVSPGAHETQALPPPPGIADGGLFSTGPLAPPPTFILPRPSQEKDAEQKD